MTTHTRARVSPKLRRRPETVRAPKKTSRTVIEPLQSDDEDDLWTLVSKAKPCGRKAVLYVGNLEENTTEDQVQEYVRRRSMKAGINQPKLHNCKVYRREEGELGNWAARITVNEASAEYLCNRNFWCGRVYARPWIFRDQARARLPSNQQSMSNNDMPDLERPGGQQLNRRQTNGN